MHGLRISTSLYDEDVKSSVNMLCHLLGAKYTERLGRNKNTHLVVPYAEGKKYEAAVGWGLHAVTVEWLHACIEAGRKVDPASSVRRRRWKRGRRESGRVHGGRR
jgi:topoisomerase (DNA) II binding protein 1